MLHADGLPKGPGVPYPDGRVRACAGKVILIRAEGYVINLIIMLNMIDLGAIGYLPQPYGFVCACCRQTIPMGAEGPG